MAFTDPRFLLFALASIVVLRATRARAIFPAVCSVLNLAFIEIFFGTVATAMLIATTALGYGIVRLAMAYGKRAGIGGILLLCIIFVELKHYPFAPEIPALSGLPAIIGLSYLVFRLLHLTIDAAERQLDRLSLLQMTAYTLFWPTLLCGPILRYPQFRSSIVEDEPRMADLARAVLGYVKVMIVAPAIFALHDFFVRKSATTVWASVDLRLVLPHVPPETLGQWTWMFGTVAAAMVWFVFLYYNFSGYMDIVIGLGRLAGFALPENFDKPFAANSFLEFWSRWHMTLSFWFRTYVFSPLYKTLLTRVPRLAPWWSSVALFLTFALVGAWHGTTSAFLVCGILLGVGAAANALYQQALIRVVGRQRMKRLNASPVYGAACFGLTFVFLAVAIMPFWMPQPAYFGFLQHLATPPAIVLAFFCGLAAVAIFLLRIVAMGARRVCAAATGMVRHRLGEDVAYGLALALAVNALVIVTFANYRQLPSFVYQGF